MLVEQVQDLIAAEIGHLKESSIDAGVAVFDGHDLAEAGFARVKSKETGRPGYAATAGTIYMTM